MEEKKSFWSEIGDYFSMKGYLTDKKDVVTRINDGISFRGPTLWVLVFAILIASLGLNINSTAVIIGAMLISPIMGPIIGMGFGVGTNDYELFKRGLINYAVATLISLITATLYFLITPYGGAQSELLARTSPTIYDVLIALCGGAAGIVAIISKDKSNNIIPGVAIATALMPPLCTAGFGIANMNLKYFLGAFYLYFINTVFIAVATYVGVRAIKMRRKVELDDKSSLRVRRYLMAIVIATMVPAAIMTVNIVRESIFNTGIEHFVNNEMKRFNGTQIISHNADKENKVLTLAAVGNELTDDEIREAAIALPKYGLFDYKLRIIQGNLSDSIMNLNNTLSNLAVSREELNSTISHQSNEITELKKKISDLTKYENLIKQIVGEIKSFYPDIESLSLSPSVETGKDTNEVNKYVSAQILMAPKSAKLKDSDISKLNLYIKNRVKADSVVVIVR